MLQSVRNKQVLKVLQRLRQKGVPEVVEFDSESAQIDDKTIASPLIPPRPKKRPASARLEEDLEEEQTDY